MSRSSTKKNFLIIGCAGYIAKKHIEAIYQLNHSVIAAFDLNSNVGFLDSYSKNIYFISSMSNLRKFLKANFKIDYIVICSPNYTHAKYIRIAYEHNIDVICEKPLCISKSSLNKILSLEKSNKIKILSIMQLRYSENISKLKKIISKLKKNEIELLYYTPRGNWYDSTWKGNEDKSGGLIFNIGVHLFDFLILLFDDPISYEIQKYSNRRANGLIKFKKFIVHWTISIDENDLPKSYKKNGSLRAIKTTEGLFHLSEKFNNLHLKSYEEIIKNRGFNVSSVFKTINFIDKMRNNQKL